MKYMVNPEQHRPRSYPRRTLIANGLMILVGAIIIFLDRNQVKQLAGKAEWNYLGIALGFVVVSYLAQSIGTVVMLRVFSAGVDKSYLPKVRTGISRVVQFSSPSSLASPTASGPGTPRCNSKPNRGLVYTQKYRKDRSYGKAILWLAEKPKGTAEQA
jgi:hypothetical protein